MENASFHNVKVFIMVFFFFWLENKELLFDCVLWYLISFEFPMEEVILVCNLTATVLLRSELD